MTISVTKKQEPMFDQFLKAFGIYKDDGYFFTPIALQPIFVRHNIYRKLSSLSLTYVEIGDEKYDLFLDVENKIIYYIASWIY